MKLSSKQKAKQKAAGGSGMDLSKTLIATPGIRRSHSSRWTPEKANDRLVHPRPVNCCHVGHLWKSQITLSRLTKEDRNNIKE